MSNTVETDIIATVAKALTQKNKAFNANLELCFFL